jgi:arylsulfatase A-like enzyme
LNRPTEIHRVVLVVLDGLRPDAVPTFSLTHIAAMASDGASTWTGRTVAPSVTAAAVASLLTGIAPARHGVVCDRFHIPRQRGPIDPLPRVLAAAGHPCSAFVRALPMLYSGLARRIARHLGVDRAHCGGTGAEEILDAARTVLATQRRGLVFLHWPDADLAGHESGWMSSAYGAGARALDAALGTLRSILAKQMDDHTLLVALADHGGGGVLATDHDSDHPDDRTVPVLLAGAGIEPGTVLDATTLLDVPATVLWALGVRRPPTYEGRVLVEAFRGAGVGVGVGELHEAVA